MRGMEKRDVPVDVCGHDMTGGSSPITVEQAVDEGGEVEVGEADWGLVELE